MTRPQDERQLELGIAGSAAVAEAVPEDSGPAVSPPGDRAASGAPPSVTTPAATPLRRKERFLSDLHKNDEVGEIGRGGKGEIFLVTEKSLRTTQAGRKYLALEFADRTGRIQASVWGDSAESIDSTIAADQFVEVTGRVATFGGQLELKVSSLKVVADEGVDLADFLPSTRRGAEDMERELQHLVKLIEDGHLRALTRACLEDADLGLRFRQAPAAKQIHHATLGGLLEHTLSVANLCLAIAEHYKPFYQLDKDLLLTAALLHDIGKVREYAWGRSFDYTDEGRMVGHLVIGAGIVAERAATIPGFPPETLLRLRHMLLSHHGQYDWGSPKRPKFPEALALHFADDLDCKLNMIEEFIQAEKQRDPDSHWTPYHRTLDRFFYKGPRPGPEKGR